MKKLILLASLFAVPASSSSASSPSAETRQPISQDAQDAQDLEDFDLAQQGRCVRIQNGRIQIRNQRCNNSVQCRDGNRNTTDLCVI